MTGDIEPVLNQLLVPEALWPEVTLWLRTRGMETAKLPAELFGEGELPTYVLIPIDCMSDPDTARITPQEEAAATAYAATFDTVPSDEAAVYMRDRLIGRGTGTDMPPGQDA